MASKGPFEIRYGKWGAYHWDESSDSDMTLQEVCDTLNDQAAEIEQLQAELHQWGIAMPKFHYCRNGKIRPYGHLTCSVCPPSDPKGEYVDFDPIAEIEKLRAENERYAAEIERLRAALLLCDRYCDHLYHAESDLHEFGKPCPVEKRIKDALGAAGGGDEET